MRRNPERLAWTVLLTAFAVFCLLVIGCPLSARWYILNARRDQKAQVEAQQGTVVVVQGDRTVASVSVGAPPIAVYRGQEVLTDGLAEGTLLVRRNQSEGPVLTTAHLYGSTRLLLREASAPRFGWSPRPYRVRLALEQGRARFTVPSETDRPVVVEVETPQAVVTFGAGGYSLVVDAVRTEVTVRQGEATVRGEGGETVHLRSEQRTWVPAGGGPVGVMPGERNLVVNGEFDQPLDVGWEVIRSRVSTDQTLGEVKLVEDEGRPAVLIERVAQGPSQTGIVQEINQDVRDFRSLQVRLLVKLLNQSLGTCGMAGSECPLMVRIDYVDVGGGERVWLQGFYYLDRPDLSEQEEPRICYQCPPPANAVEHLQYPQGVWQEYISPNLMETLGELRPAYIKRIAIYASGHAYASMATGVELLAQE